MKYDNEFRTARNVKQIVHRSLQFAHSDPKGPVYLVGAREVMEEETERVAADVAEWPPIAPAPLAEAAVAGLGGRHAESGEAAGRHLLSRAQSRRGDRARPPLRPARRGRAGIGAERTSTIRITTRYIRAITGTIRSRTAALAEADFVLVVDSDVPWIPTVSKPSDKAAIAIIDVDPLKQSIPLWYIKARRCYRADAATALAQLNAASRSRRDR